MAKENAYRKIGRPEVDWMKATIIVVEPTPSCAERELNKIRFFSYLWLLAMA